MEELVVATMMTFGLCLLGAYAFIGLPWLVLMAFILFCCRIVHECLRSKYPPQQFGKDSAVESAILPTERLGGKSIWIGSEGFAVQDFAPHRYLIFSVQTFFMPRFHGYSGHAC